MPTSVAWRDLTLGSASGQQIVSVEGWESLPPPRYDKQPRARGHGAHSSPVWADERIVTVTGTSPTVGDRDATLLALQSRFTFDGGEEPLTIALAGRTLTAAAQLLRADPVIATGSWNAGLIKWVAQWRCPDPLRYAPREPLSTGLPVPGGGLAFPLFGATGFLEFGTPGAPGQVTLTNAGTADAPVLFDVQAGPTYGIQQGFEISADGKRITYPTVVPPGQLITVNTGDGSVLAEGTADRLTELTYADWLLIPAATPDGTPGRLTVQFTSLGGTPDPATLLTARWGDTYW